MLCWWCFQPLSEAINSLQYLDIVQALSGNGIQTSASSDQVEAVQGDVLTPISTKQGFFQKCAAVYHQLMPHLVRAIIWFDSCFRVECHELGQALQPTRAVVVSDYPWTGWEKREGVCTSTKVEKQQKQNSLKEEKLRQTGHSETKILINLRGQWPWAERGKGGDDTWNGNDASQGISLVSCLHTRVQWCNLRGPCLDGHRAQLSAHRNDRALSDILLHSRSEGHSWEGGGWAAKYWERKRVWGVRRCLGRNWRSLKLKW